MDSPLALEQRVKDNILHVPERLRLHKRISSDSRQFRQAGSDWELVQALRSWAYTHVCEQEEIEATLDQRSDVLFAEADAPAMFAAFEARVAGVWCGGIGQALRKLYQMYGFDAYVLDCGARATGSTHISNVVRIWHDARALWSVQDAYYELAYAESGGAPLDLLDMLCLLRERRDRDVMVCSGPRDPRPLLTLGDETLLRMSWRIDPPYPQSQPEQVLPDGRLLFRTRPSVEALIAHGRADNLFEVLRQHGLPERLVYLYCLIFGVYPSDAVGAPALLATLHKCLQAVPGE